jgi:hypothetical protein
VLWLLLTVAARSREWAVFARSNTRVLGSNPTRSMDVSVRLFCLCYSVRMWWPGDRLIPNPRGCIDCVYDQQAEAQERTVEY